MQAVILAAGKGLRMEELTKDTPKPLLKYKNKSLLEWKLENLPEKITEVIIVVGYLKEKIITHIGNEYCGKKIVYIEDTHLAGTGTALWQSKSILHDSFLVMMGDDIYSKESLLNASKEAWSITVQEVSRENNASRIIKNEHGHLKDFVTAETYRSQHRNNGCAFTGLYSLSENIFEYPLVKLQTKEEWGLPQTLLGASSNLNIKILQTNGWEQITSPEDLIK